MAEKSRKVFATTQDAANEAARILTETHGFTVSVLRRVKVPRIDWDWPYYWSVTTQDGSHTTVRMAYSASKEGWTIEFALDEVFFFSKGKPCTPNAYDGPTEAEA